MNTNVDVVQSDGPDVETSKILEFLIKRCNDILASDRPILPLVLRAFGYAALDGEEELVAQYKEISSSSSLPPEEIIRACIGIFQMSLDRGAAECPSIHPGTEKDCPELGKQACRHVMMTALHEGKIMLEERDYRFLKIFGCLAWIGLQCDREWLAEFDRVRKSFVDDPEGLIEAATDILREALFRRRPSCRVRSLSS